MTEFVAKGIMTALVTPFDSEGSINGQVINELMDFQVQSGVSAVVTTAGSGEYITLQPEERAEVTRLAANALGGRIPLVAGVLAPDTRSAIAASLAAKDAGADAILLLTPYYVSPSIPGIVSHIRAVAERVSLPIVLYNIPSRTGINLDVPALEQLVEIPDVIGIKECDRDLGRVAMKIKRLGSRLSFLSGDDDLCLPIWSIGAKGGIMASTNLVAPWAVKGFDAWKGGDWNTASEMFYEYILPFVALYRGPDHPGPMKQCLQLAGFPVGTGRPPLHPMSADRLDEIAKELDKLGISKQAAAIH